MSPFLDPKWNIFGPKKKSFWIQNDFIFDAKKKFEPKKKFKIGPKIKFGPEKKILFGPHFASFWSQNGLKSTKMSPFRPIFGHFSSKSAHFDRISSKSATFLRNRLDFDRNLPDLELARARASLSQALARAGSLAKRVFCSLAALEKLDSSLFSLAFKLFALGRLACAAPSSRVDVFLVLAHASSRAL